MTDNRERIFIQIAYEGGSIDAEELIGNLSRRLADLPQDVLIQKDRPPRIFTESELEERFLALYMACERFRTKYKAYFDIELELDPRLLYIATISAFDDIERYKAYHLEKPYKQLSDAVKRCAYLTKWISRMSPLQSRFNPEQQHIETADIPKLIDAKPALGSILFSIMVCMTHISVECQKKIFLDPEVEFQLAYDILYRRINEDSLLSTYQKILDLARGNQIIKIA